MSLILAIIILQRMKLDILIPHPTIPTGTLQEMVLGTAIILDFRIPHPTTPAGTRPIIILDIRIRALETTHGGAQIPLEIVAGLTTLDIQIQAPEILHGDPPTQAETERFIIPIIQM